MPEEPLGGETDFTLQLLHFADIDGQPQAIDNVGDFTRLVNEFEGEHPHNTLLVSSGDNYIPGPRFFAANDDAMESLLGIPGEGRADMIFLNEMGVTASAVGNHDLDNSPEGFVSAVAPETDEDNEYPGAEFPFLAANIDFSTDENTAPRAVEGGRVTDAIPAHFAPSAVTVVGGEVIGLVGATTPQLSSITSTGDLEISPDSDSVEELAEVIQPAVDRLTERGVDKIVLLAHMQQVSVERELAGELSGVDIIVAGGSNTILADETDTLWPNDEAADTYPVELTSETGEPVLLVNVDGDYRYLGRLVVGFDSEGVLIPDTVEAEQSGAYATHEDAMDDIDAEANERVVAVTEGIQEVLQRREGNILGRTDVYLDGRRSEVRTEETNLGNITADANLWYAKETDSDTVISLKNGGGIRSAIGDSYVPAGSTGGDPELGPPPAIESVGKPEGGISQFDIEGSLRFNNGLTLLDLTAAELWDLMEHAVSATEEGATPGQFPQVGGMRFSFDPSREARDGDTENMGADTNGNRIRDLVIVDEDGEVADRVVVEGELQGDPERSFRLVTLGFLAGGGDGYPFEDLSEPDMVNLEESGETVDPGRTDFAPVGSEQDALAEYLQARYADDSSAIEMEESPKSEDERIQNLDHRDSSLR
ncbi:MAG: 5'-nucleotidase C-terminal domain-containing protein [Spirochaetia bacterium]